MRQDRPVLLFFLEIQYSQLLELGQLALLVPLVLQAQLLLGGLLLRLLGGARVLLLLRAGLGAPHVDLVLQNALLSLVLLAGSTIVHLVHN